MFPVAKVFLSITGIGLAILIGLTILLFLHL